MKFRSKKVLCKNLSYCSWLFSSINCLLFFSLISSHCQKLGGKIPSPLSSNLRLWPFPRFLQFEFPRIDWWWFLMTLIPFSVVASNLLCAYITRLYFIALSNILRLLGWKCKICSPVVELPGYIYQGRHLHMPTRLFCLTVLLFAFSSFWQNILWLLAFLFSNPVLHLPVKFILFLYPKCNECCSFECFSYLYWSLLMIWVLNVTAGWLLLPSLNQALNCCSFKK